MAIGVSAQSRSPLVTVSGKVFDAGNQKPLSSISIIVRPSRLGTTTRPDGSFGLKARPGDTVTFTSVGYKPASYLVNANPVQANLKIVLTETPVQLKEVEVESRLSQEKINRVLRNMKKSPDPDPVKAPPAPEPLFEEKETHAVAPTIMNPASFLYEKYSKEGKQKQKLEEIRQQKEDSIRWKKEADYDQLFLDRNLPFKHYYNPMPFSR